MFTTTHDDKPATIYVLDSTVYATYDDDNDVFYHVDIDDDSVNLHDDLVNEFGPELTLEILAEIGRN